MKSLYRNLRTEIVTKINSWLIENTQGLITAEKMQVIMDEVVGITDELLGKTAIKHASYHFTTNKTLSSLVDGYVTDTVTLHETDIIMLSGQASLSDNGIWEIKTGSAPVRPGNFDTAEKRNGVLVMVQNLIGTQTDRLFQILQVGSAITVSVFWQTIPIYQLRYRGIVQPSTTTLSDIQNGDNVRCGINGTYINFSGLVANAGDFLFYNTTLGTWQKQDGNASMYVFAQDVDAAGFGIKNVKDAVDDGDVVPKSQAESLILEAISPIVETTADSLIDAGIIPSKSSALVWCDGTILFSGGSYYFVDVISGKNFLITDYDFPDDWVKGFPEKSAATISAPVGDAVLIAADLNNFLYDSGGTPNQIPVVSLSQNIDLEDKFFSRRIAQAVDENGVEIYEARIIDFVIYNSVRTSTSLLLCKYYYAVEDEVVGAYWIDPSGSDIAAGTKAAPWQTLLPAFGLTGGKTVYQKSDPTVANTASSAYITDNYNQVIKAIGRVKNTTVTNTYGLMLGASFNKISRFIIDSNATVYPIYSTGVNAIIEKLYFTALVKGAKIITGTFKQINGCIIKGDSTTHFFDLIGSQNYTIENNLILANTDGNGLNLTGTGTGVIKNNKFKGWAKLITIRVAENGITVLGNRFECKAGQLINVFNGKSSTINYNSAFLKVTVGGVTFIYGSTGATINAKGNIVTTEDDFVGTLISAVNCSSLIEENILSKGTVTAGGLIINHTCSDATAKTIHIKGNKLLLADMADTYSILIGTDTADGNAGNNTADVLVEKTYFRGAWDMVTEGYRSHTLFIGYQKNAVVRFNNFLHGGIPIVMEGQPTTVDDLTAKGVHHNVFCDQHSSPLGGGWNNQNWYNNTIIYRSTMPEATVGLSISPSNNGAHPDNCKLKNNIVCCNAVGTFMAVSFGQKLSNECDYNIYYAKGTLVFGSDGNSYTFAQWQALGFDTHSIVLTEEQYLNLFNDVDNADFSLATGSEAIGSGIDLGADYDDGLDASTDWGIDTEVPIVVTKQQGASWDCGAYIS